MGFTEDITRLAEQVQKNADRVVGEQATKMSLIAPFFSALGYDVFDPSEVIPEYVADFATKKAGQFEKVDYAIAINGTIVMIVEAKARDKKPEAHDGQLKKYFNALISTKVSIVTNGVEYRFFTDLRHENIMDDEPFFAFDVLDYDSKDLENLKFFHKDNFDINLIKVHAEELVYVKGLTELVGNLLRSPSKDFMSFLLKELGKLSPSYEIEGKINDRKIQRFQPIIKKAIQISLVDLMTRSISQEIGKSGEEQNTNTSDEIIDAVGEQETMVDAKVETTEEELAAFEKVKEIVAASKDYHLEIKYKDVVSYFGINVGKVTWWFLRLYLSQKKKSFVTRLPIETVKSLASDFEVQEMTASLGDATSRVIISSIEDLDKLTPLILKCYEAEASKHI
ncbi:type I restriction endonuclease [Thermocoleostomius sinensis]|uniref:Type I restriction endonuclease n=1 Tax=Thermocoleostomius sinensis A174 TaxID=2016057 RepID=A0A9E9C6Q1_9CYAN|nr:type I restriction endonuclease [Thermocoleostomius sinensis]WAL59494.1 type I restriction endonuclease [Thermocoleostomius sinensis A174]